MFSPIFASFFHSRLYTFPRAEQVRNLADMSPWPCPALSRCCPINDISIENGGRRWLHSAAPVVKSHRKLCYCCIQDTGSFTLMLMVRKAKKPLSSLVMVSLWKEPRRGTWWDGYDRPRFDCV